MGISADLYNIGGIHARVHHLDGVLHTSGASSLPITVLFLLHGRLGSSKDTFSIVEQVLSASKDASTSRDLLIVTFVRQVLFPTIDHQFR